MERVRHCSSLRAGFVSNSMMKEGLICLLSRQPSEDYQILSHPRHSKIFFFIFECSQLLDQMVDSPQSDRDRSDAGLKRRARSRSISPGRGGRSGSRGSDTPKRKKKDKDKRLVTLIFCEPVYILMWQSSIYLTISCDKSKFELI